MSRDADDIYTDHLEKCFEAGLDHRQLHRGILYPARIVAEGDEKKTGPAIPPDMNENTQNKGQNQ